jgi:hypothetical protein
VGGSFCGYSNVWLCEGACHKELNKSQDANSNPDELKGQKMASDPI